MPRKAASKTYVKASRHTIPKGKKRIPEQGRNVSFQNSVMDAPDEGIVEALLSVQFTVRNPAGLRYVFYDDQWEYT